MQNAFSNVEDIQTIRTDDHVSSNIGPIINQFKGDNLEITTLEINNNKKINVDSLNIEQNLLLRTSSPPSGKTINFHF